MASPIPAPPPYASATLPGIVSTGAQVFAGVKTFAAISVKSFHVTEGGVKFPDGSVQATAATGSGSVTVAAPITGDGSSGSPLSVRDASNIQSGVVSTGVQTFAGNKAFSGTITASNLSGTNTGNVTIGTANGLSLAGQALSLGTASGSTTGALTSAHWTAFNAKESPLLFAGPLSRSGNTISIKGASDTEGGIVTTNTQIFSGTKRFQTGIDFEGDGTIFGSPIGHLFIDTDGAGVQIGRENSSTVEIGHVNSWTSVHSLLETNGARKTKITAAHIIATTTLDHTYHHVICNPTIAGVDIILPIPSSQWEGVEYYIKNISPNRTVRVIPEGGVIDGSSIGVFVGGATYYNEAIKVVCDGTNWFIF